MKDLAILCPSRGRPALCRQMVESALRTSTADVLIYVEDDDAARGEHQFQDPRVIVHVGPHEYRGPAVNRLCDAYRDYRMYLLVSDDVTFTRDGWDVEVIAAMDSFGDAIGLVDLEGGDHAPYANWVVLSRAWIDVLGWFNPPTMKWFCQDTALQALAQSLGRRTRLHGQVIHHHITYDYDLKPRIVEDTEAFLWYMAKDFASDLSKLRAAMSS